MFVVKSIVIQINAMGYGSINYVCINILTTSNDLYLDYICFGMPQP